MTLELELSIQKVIPPKVKRLIRDLHKVTDDDLITNFCDEKVSITDDLDLAVSSFNDELKWVLDIVTPEKEKVISMRKLPICYDEAVREQHCIMKKYERIWQKYWEDHQWKAYKVERNHYNHIVQSKKKKQHTIRSDKSQGGHKTTLQHRGPNKLEVQKSNPLPEEEFTDFFLNKILIIRKQFWRHQPIHANYKRHPNLTEICTNVWKRGEGDYHVHEEQMLWTWCLANLPLKEDNWCVSSIHYKNSEFFLWKWDSLHTQWKVAIVRLLLKKLGLDLINKNYRPVSNLSFLSKVIEKAMLKQFNQHCNNYGLLPDYQSAYRSNYSCENISPKIDKWHIVEYGKQTSDSTGKDGFVSHIWHHWSWTAPRNTSPQIWHQWRCSQVVRQLPEAQGF